MISFTIDLEDHRQAYAGDGRWVAATERLLDFCAARKIRATFFAVGRCAENATGLLKKIGACHELALHSYDHIPLMQEDASRFAAKLSDAKKKLEDLAGKAVTGFRAPRFSLTPKSVWVVEELAKLGFAYSSSVIPGKGVFSGFPGAPRQCFRWKSGLIEVPVPSLKIAETALPYLGGVYLKLLPLALVKAQLRAEKHELPWTFIHPYDIDAEEGFVRFTDGTPLWANALLMQGRKNFLRKMEKLLREGIAPPLGEGVAALLNLPTFAG
jgi:polysaccharide deacetylase family protein (PEP-CTERM system associated)